MKLALLTLLLVVMFSISALAVVPVTGEDAEPATPAAEQPDAAGDFTHFVLAEEITTTWCGYCPTAAAQLADIYYNDSYEYYFVALISDVNYKAKEREGDYPTFYGYPTVYFDGGDEEVVGAQSDKSTYQDSIETCGTRDDTKINLELDISFEGDSTINVDVGVQWDEQANIFNPTFDAYLRVYITEIESRYINAAGHPYHFGFLDYAFDEQVELMPSQWWEDSVSWTGSDYHDANGDDFGDIDFSNMAIIAAVFNDEDSDADEYALQTKAVVSPGIDISGPDGEVYMTEANETVLPNLEVEVDAESRYTGGEPVALSDIEYAVNGNDYEMMEQDEDGKYTTTLDRSQIQKVNNTIMVRVTDERGFVVEKEFNVLFGLLPSEDEPAGLSAALVGSIVLGTIAVAGWAVHNRKE